MRVGFNWDYILMRIGINNVLIRGLNRKTSYILLISYSVTKFCIECSIYTDRQQSPSRWKVNIYLVYFS